MQPNTESLQLSWIKSALDKLMKYPFPGNVRELQYTMERAIIMSDDEVLCERDLLFSPIESSVTQTMRTG